MNQLSSKQRKLIYFLGIVVLSAPIIYLGTPSTGRGESSGGKLAQLRTEYELGESTLGQVDPSSATMNLVLLGMRGIASSVLWHQAIEQQENKDWAGLKATTESIILLQPHFLQVWRFQGWNLSYNVSAEWDDVRDRYYWVKEGAKFLMDGTERNEKMAELYWDVGNTLGAKIGRADEWRYFRQYFLKDPDEEKYAGGPDPRLNAEGKDNYLEAQDWFYDANRVENEPGVEQHIMMRMLFRQYPARMQFGFAQALQREGEFSERCRAAWDKAYELWTKEFGREEFISPVKRVILEFTEEDLQRLAEEDGYTVEDKRRWTASYQDRCQYRYWRSLAAAEAEQNTREAHQDLYDGQQLYRQQRFREAQELLERGMQKYEIMLRDYQDLANEDSAIEEAMLAILYWQNIHFLQNKEIPEEYPLRDIWQKHQNRLPTIEIEFRRQNTL